MGPQYRMEHPGVIPFQGAPCPDGRPTVLCAMSDRLPTDRTQDTWIWAPSIGQNTLELSHSRAFHVLMVRPHSSVPCHTDCGPIIHETLGYGPPV